MASWIFPPLNAAGPLFLLLHFFNRSARNHPSTFLRAQGVFRRNVRLDFTLGSWRKQRTGMRRPILAHPWRSTSRLTMVSSVIPCRGSRGWEMGAGWVMGSGLRAGERPEAAGSSASRTDQPEPFSVSWWNSRHRRVHSGAPLSACTILNPRRWPLLFCWMLTGRARSKIPSTDSPEA